MKSLITILAICLFGSNLSFSQQDYDPEAKYAITKNDGTIYIGKILSDDGREILILTDNLGKIYIPKSDIRSIKKIDDADVKRGVYVGENIFTTRYQFTTNSFPIKKGENYAMVNLYGPEVHFSVADNLSVGVMATWIGSPIVLALKYTIPTQNEMLNFGAGTLIGTSGYLNQARGFGGLHWGMATYGDRHNNMTASVGYGYFNLGDKSFDYLIPGGTYLREFDQWGNSKINFPDSQPYGSNTFNAPIVGLSGMFGIGEKATFVIDFMGVFAYRQRYYQTIIYDGFDLWSSNQAIVSNPTAYKARSTNLIIMPGIRFQKKDNRAFQFSLAGVIGSNSRRESSIYSSNSGQVRKNNYSFPIPMVSWFFKF